MVTPRPDGRRRPGSSLVEALVAIVILGICVLGAAATAALAARLTREAEARAEAVALAGVVLDSLLRVDAPAAGERRRPRARMQWAVRPAGRGSVIDLVIEHHDGTRLQRRQFGMFHALPPRRPEGGP